jgi:hypothetical protein
LGEDPLAAWRRAAARRLDGNENGIDVGLAPQADLPDGGTVVDLVADDEVDEYEAPFLN